MKIYKTEKEIKILFIVLLLGIVVLFWSSTTQTPYWWDSAGYVVHAARYYIDTNFSSIFLPSDASLISAFAHPPFFVFSLALVWKIFGESLIVSHLFYLIFIGLAIVFTYLLGEKIAHFKNKLTNHLIGFSSALALLFSPLFLAQTGIIYPEIPIAAFSVMAVYFFITKRFWWYFASIFLAIFSKESAVVVLLAILASIVIKFLIRALKDRQLEFKKLVKSLLIYGSPIFLLIIWYACHKLATGWTFVMPYYQGHLTEGLFDFRKILFTFKYFFLEQGRSIPFVIILVCFFWSIFRPKLRARLLALKNILIPFIIILFVPFLFGILDFLPRYLVFGLPFFYILFFVFLGKSFSVATKSVITIVLIILLLTSASQWDNHRQINNWHYPPLEENLEYLDVIEVGKEMASFIEHNYPEASVYTDFPSHYMLGESFQHYVSKDIEVHACLEYKEGDKVDLIVFHFLSPGQTACLQLMRDLSFSSVVKTFEKNGKEMKIYEKGDQVFKELPKEATPELPFCAPI